MNQRNNNIQPEGEDKKPIPDEILATRDAWYRQFRKWNIIHYGVGALAVGSSSLTALLATSEPTVWQIYLSGIAALCAGFITLFKPANKARAPLHAWRELNKACLQYLHTKGYPFQGVIDARLKGEEIMREQDPE